MIFDNVHAQVDSTTISIQSSSFTDTNVEALLQSAITVVNQYQQQLLATTSATNSAVRQTETEVNSILDYIVNRRLMGLPIFEYKQLLEQIILQYSQSD